MVPKWHEITAFSRLSHIQLPPPSTITTASHHSSCLNRFRKNKQTLAKSCPVHCQQDAHQPQQQPFWIRSNVGDTSPLDGPSVAPGKLPAAPLFVPARWLELPSVFGQMHPKETPDACCRVPCGFRRAKQNKPILILPQKKFRSVVIGS